MGVSKRTPQCRTTTTKEPTTKTKTVDVIVTDEEVTIEKRSKSGQTEAQTPVSSREDMTIPVKKVEVEVTKTPYVKEEATAERNPLQKQNKSQKKLHLRK